MNWTPVIIYDRRIRHRLPRILFIEVGDLWTRFLRPALGGRA